MDLYDVPNILEPSHPLCFLSTKHHILWSKNASSNNVSSASGILLAIAWMSDLSDVLPNHLPTILRGTQYTYSVPTVTLLFHNP